MSLNGWNAQKLAQLGASFGVELDKTALERFETYAAALQEWNAKVNLTAITGADGILVKHFADSLSLLRYVRLPQGAKLIDVGTGGGFPGLALKIARPDLQVTLLDGTAKKLRVLEDIQARLGLETTLLHARAEDAGHDPALRERFDIATARAVANLRELAEYCLPFVRVGGTFAAMKSARVAEELADAKAALRLLSGKVTACETFQLADAGERSVVLIEKCSPLSGKYPRPSAKIAKNPLVK